MTEQGYLIFSLNNSLYCLETNCVEEIFFLPELTSIPEAPRELVGVLNLRGEILPVIDLNLRLGYGSPDYQLTDSIIVIRWQKSRVGIIVNEVQEVRTISSEEITTQLSYGQEVGEGSSNSGFERHKFVAGIAKSGEDLLIPVDPEHLLGYVEKPELNLTEDPEEGEEEIQNNHHGNEELLAQKRGFCLNASPEERAIFRQRAESLRKTSATEDLTGFKPIAVVVLNNEFFAIDLNLVREFADIKKVTPIPCCPPHIIGNMNLRGEILTLIDIRGLLNLSLDGMANGSKAIVVQVEDIMAGIIGEKVFDVMFINPEEITSVPTAVHSLNDEYVVGTAPYQDKMMSILDINKVLLAGGLIVDQTV
ncbi:MAG: purine-binding chemotaxis protein CheW [Gomphosphaeria aponina SAG 52.96 = DSM 107014]|uniref:Purine-binding chemotaxis protein CheW n=1 Tax=Gomphosphaeria aponina SAG 52.96 = DSM 107014 TaxID=1521640 RepID=A0A941GN14_9CHRO|nr:purine-binding chemotaxis protein CheW [Gomphosphaeria aponina SAG 52.96 = DSM 107014]